MKFFIENHDRLSSELIVPFKIGQLFSDDTHQIYVLSQFEITRDGYNVVLRLRDDQRRNTKLHNPKFNKLNNGKLELQTLYSKFTTINSINLEGPIMKNNHIYLHPVTEDDELFETIKNKSMNEYRNTMFPSYFEKNDSAIKWETSQYNGCDIYAIILVKKIDDSFDTTEHAVGFIIVGDHFDEKVERKFIMVIAEKYRRQHIGTKALEALSQMHAALGILELYGWDNKIELNSYFLKKCGFKHIDASDGNGLYRKDTIYTV